MFLLCLVFAMFCARLFICASWSPAGKGLTSWLSFVVSSVSLSLSHWYPGSVWYLIVSIPDLCNLTYFQSKHTSNSGFHQTFIPCSGYILIAAELRVGYQISWVDLQREVNCP